MALVFVTIRGHGDLRASPSMTVLSVSFVGIDSYFTQLLAKF